MRTVLIVKMGTTLPSLAKRRGVLERSSKKVTDNQFMITDWRLKTEGILFFTNDPILKSSISIYWLRSR